ncbi:MAG: exodeoxyribonuclease VII large subunit [Pirellulales bacterium]|nr:exodeoxyribonuclease VII large subunit [Pirellulales bacterium]
MAQRELFPDEPELPAAPAAEAQQPSIWSVAELTLRLKDLLETAFPAVWVAGEISNLSRPQSGHCYLTLKDDEAQIRAVIWRGTANRVRFDLHDGLEVVCFGHLDVYAPRGTYQLVIEQIEPQGIGALELALRQLRARLAAEGLFDPAHKRSLPRFPRTIGVVTSPSGAAVRDFLEVLKRRWRGADVLIFPVRVQGDGAGLEVARAIQLANCLPQPPEVLVVTRGGGSLEDLWAFNEEHVVRAIHASRIPVVSAIGHEIDVTLADLVADVRALTPSEAAERVVPSAAELREVLAQRSRRLVAALRSRAVSARARLDALAAHRTLRRPLDRVHDLARRVDELAARAARAATHRTRDTRRRIETVAARLESLSPVAVLGRGYSVTLLENSSGERTVVRSAAELQTGDTLVTRFARGQATSRVESIEPGVEPSSGEA